MTWWEDQLSWHAGRWSLQLRGDELADIALEGITVLRSIRAAVRDEDWNTARLTVDDVRTSTDTLDIDVHTHDLGARLAGTLRVAARESELTVDLELRCRRAFSTNRTGLVVLHPASLAGTPLRVTHTDGTTQHTVFPQDISPHQPVHDIRRLAWHLDAADVSVGFQGDVFEMEDQRNWSDASYKTYSRPLALPFPYLVEDGQTVRQTVRLHAAPRPRSTAATAQPAADTAASDRLQLVAGGAFPDILLGVSTAPDPCRVLPPIGAGRLVELDLGSRTWRAALQRAATTGMSLDVRLVLADGDRAALDAAAVALRDVDVMRVSAFPPTGPSRHVSDAVTVTALRAALARAGVDAPVVGGARSHFTELNREYHRLPPGLAGVVFSITPLFHSIGTDQLVESLAVQRVIARQAAAMTSRPVHIGPVTLRPRFNDVATTPPRLSTRDDLRDGYGPALLPATDPRQRAPELAAWAIASAAALAVPGVASLTYFETSGPRGIYDDDGRALPVAGAIAALAGLRGRRLLHAESPDGLLWAIGGSASGAATVHVANVSRLERRASVTFGRSEHEVALAPGSWTTLHGDVPA